jgi:hypothetical protein
MRPTALLLALSATIWLRAAEDLPPVEVALTTGETIIGGLVERTDEHVIVRLKPIRGSGMSADRNIPAAQVATVTTLADDYRQRAAAAPAGAADQAQLARWCFDHGMAAEARLHAEKALTAESTNAVALTTMHQLGLARIDGTWQDIDGWLTAKGLVRFDGLVVTPAVRDQLKALAAQRTADAQALTEAQAGHDRAQGLLATANDRTERLTKQRADTAANQTEVDHAKQALETAKKAAQQTDTRLAEAEKRARERPRNTNNNGNNNQNNNQASSDVSDAQAAQKKSQQAVTQAQQAETKAAAAAADRLAKIDKDLTTTKADITRLGEQVATADKTLPAKQAAATASAAKYKEARDAVHLPEGLPGDLVTAIYDLSQRKM